jgi:isopenicillin-N epimerase
MATIPLPESERFPPPIAGSEMTQDPVHDVLFDEHRIEVPILRNPVDHGRMVRVSAQLYNQREDYERLAAALATIL